ncbi:MAG TPA: hypothetical protein VK009_04050 [Chloroflexota bacterium]|nr:hypothetical protein [Chloroflexota bacterium]
MPTELAERILQDCRGAVGEVRFGFGSKRQVWAFEDRHRLDVPALAEELASSSPAEFLDLAVAFHDEFAAVSNAWRARDRIQALTAEMCRAADPPFLDRVAGALIDDHLGVRHWLVAAYLVGPPLVAFRGLEEALPRAYLPQDQWALLARLRTLAEANGWAFGPDTSRTLASLAQFSARPEDRQLALELLARFGGPAAMAALDRAARGDADPAVRAKARELLPNVASSTTAQGSPAESRPAEPEAR